MREFTPTEIELCKRIAEIYIMEIHYGVLVVKEKKKVIEVSFWNLPIGLTEKQRKQGKWTPLWQEHNCLEWLGKKFQKLRVCSDGQFEIEYWLKRGGCYYEYGKTPLEALLSAVLAIMEEK